MKKRFGSVIAVFMVSALALTGCGAGGEREQETRADGTIIGAIEKKEATADLSFLKSDNMCVLPGTYIIGQDMKAGDYTLKCSEADYGMRVTVFESEDKYHSYFSSDRFTIGENNDAIKDNAKTDEFVYEGDDLSVNVSDGNVLVIDDGDVIGTFGNGSNMEPGETITIGRGLYEVGDIEPGMYCVTPIEADYAMQFVVFKDENAYSAFVKANPFTVGEYSEQIGKNGLSELYVDENQHGFLTIKEGNLLTVIGEGKAEITKVDMGWK